MKQECSIQTIRHTCTSTKPAKVQRNVFGGANIQRKLTKPSYPALDIVVSATTATTTEMLTTVSGPLKYQSEDVCYNFLEIIKNIG